MQKKDGRGGIGEMEGNVSDVKLSTKKYIDRK